MLKCSAKYLRYKKKSKKRYSERNLTDQSEKKSIYTTPNPLSKIKEIQIRNGNKLIISNLNINSIRNKFEQLKETVLWSI